MLPGCANDPADARICPYQPYRPATRPLCLDPRSRHKGRILGRRGCAVRGVHMHLFWARRVVPGPRTSGRIVPLRLRGVGTLTLSNCEDGSLGPKMSSPVPPSRFCSLRTLACSHDGQTPHDRRGFQHPRSRARATRHGSHDRELAPWPPRDRCATGGIAILELDCGELHPPAEATLSS